MPPDIQLPEYPPQGLRRLQDFEGTDLELSDYADLETILDAAGESGVVDVPAESAEAAREGRANLLRDAVIAEWLWLLGYLPTRDMRATSSHPGERAQCLAAIKAFQEDASLKPDEWAGEKTWAALKQLVTFETPTNARAYWHEGRPMPALVRATRLRLWALGCLDTQPDASNESETVPETALLDFLLLVKRFGMVPYGDPPPPLEAQIGQLFDQDRILSAVKDASKREPNAPRKRVFSYLKEHHEKRRVVEPVVERFLASLAKVELWLLGLDVDIGPERDYPVYRFKNVHIRRNKKLKRALKEFWKKLGRRRGRLVRFITPELFGQLANPTTSATIDMGRFTAPDYSRKVTQEIRTTEHVEEAWQRGKSLGMRLWDGFKRVWRWILRGIHKIIQIGRNIVRAFFRYAMKAFQIVRVAVRAVTRSIVQYVSGEIESHERLHLLVGKDGDMLMLIPAGAAIGDMARAVRVIDYFGAAFRLACMILRTVLRTIRVALTGAVAPIVGWARLLWLLVQSYRDIRPLYLELRSLPKPGVA